MTEEKNLFDQIKDTKLTPEDIQLLSKSIKSSMFKTVLSIMDNLDQLKDSSNSLLDTISRMDGEVLKHKLELVKEGKGGDLMDILKSVVGGEGSNIDLIKEDAKLYQDLINELGDSFDDSIVYKDGTKVSDDEDSDSFDITKVDYAQVYENLKAIAPKFNSFIDFNIMFFTKGTDIMVKVLKSQLEETNSDELKEKYSDIEGQSEKMMQPFIDAVEQSKEGFKKSLAKIIKFKDVNSKVDLLTEIIS